MRNVKKGKKYEKKVQIKRVRTCLVHCKSDTYTNIFLSYLYHAFYASPTVETDKRAEDRILIVKTVQAEDVKQKDYIEETAECYGISPKIVKAIIKVESGGNANAVGDAGNSIGLMQIQPRYHAQRLKEGESLLDPKVNVRVGCEILSEIMAKHGTLDEVLTVYNAGHDTGDRSYANRVYEEME